MLSGKSWPPTPLMHQQGAKYAEEGTKYTAGYFPAAIIQRRQRYSERGSLRAEKQLHYNPTERQPMQTSSTRKGDRRVEEWFLSKSRIGIPVKANHITHELVVKPYTAQQSPDGRQPQAVTAIALHQHRALLLPRAQSPPDPSHSACAITFLVQMSLCPQNEPSWDPAPGNHPFVLPAPLKLGSALISYLLPSMLEHNTNGVSSHYFRNTQTCLYKRF